MPKFRRVPKFYFVLLIAVVVPLLSMIPTWYGYRQAHPPEKIFMGFRFMAPDNYMYGSFAVQAADEGRLFMENRFTTEPQKGRFLLLGMWITGQICRITGLDFPAAWKVLTVIAGIAFMLATWSFTGFLFKEASSRMLAYVFVGFSGGLGWLLFLITGAPEPGITLPFVRDAFNHQWNWSTFGSMLAPLWIGPEAILLLCASFLAREGKNSVWRQLLLFVLPPLIWFIHPYTGIAAYFTFGLLPLVPVMGALWRIDAIPWDQVRDNLRRVSPALLSLIIVASYLLWARQDKVYAINGHTVFIWNPTYSVFLYPFAYGLLLPLAIYGLKWVRSLHVRAREVMIAWLASSVILSVNPFLAGTKFQYLVHLPLALFGAHGVFELSRRADWARVVSKGAGAMVLGVLLFLNTPLVLLKDFPATKDETLIYRSTSELEAIKFLKDKPFGNVLCDAKSGNLIPWLAAKKVYVGHWFLTINHNEKQAKVVAFFDPSGHPDQKRDWLKEQGIRYVYVGPDEGAMGGVDPALGLRTIYDADGVKVYEVP